MQPPAPPHPTTYSEALADTVWQKRCALLYQAWVQLRYHRKRQRFFDLTDKGTKTVTLVLGASLFGEHVASLKWVATGISALGLMALVFGYDERKQAHKELADQAAALAAAIEALPARDVSVEATAEWAAQYARLCANAPPQLKTLTLLCEREQSTVDGHPNHIPLPPWWRRWTAQIKA